LNLFEISACGGMDYYYYKTPQSNKDV
jgi:hypothetical protein